MSQPSWIGPAGAEPAFEAPREHRLDFRFTGSGSEYFRIWIVNLLLTIVTLGVYYPWAKVRRLRYFYGNTLVGGQPLDFHGNPMTMLRGYVLIAVMGVLYSVAGRFSAVAGLVAFIILAAIWPALLRSSMQFRLANTSWRGLRFRFVGSLGDAYAAFLPAFVPGIAIVAALAAVSDPEQPPAWYAALMGIVSLVALAFAPWLWWKLKKYQHDHYALGPWRTRLTASCGSFYLVFLKTAGAALAAGLLVGVVVSVVAVLGIVGSSLGGSGRSSPLVAMVIGLVLAFTTLLAMQLVPRPYFTSRMQNLLWSRTGNEAMRFGSQLRFWPLFGLTLKNWLLVALTLGLYWPFAAVASQRMRIEAVSVTALVDPDDLIDQARGAEGEAAGDAAGDLFGLDIGL
ncbi:YjgN family protein [Piscinibacter sp. XHJ-5]|uniref:YjgN family protein n=1 Tax=Piscinibacter sp. XHJ-5 TaxID=3037797 RepID=UPI00245345D1|nr:YjgN family protein [Piscinibacter sp. XHJ-5]